MGIVESNFVRELNSKGYKYSGINHLFKQDEPLPLEVVNIILKWLPEVYKEHLGSGECLVRSLISSGEPFDPSVLIDLFENSDLNETNKCSIAFVISISKTTDVTNWLRGQLLNEAHSFGRAGLLHGIVPKGGFTEKDELREFFKAIFDKYAYYESLQKLIQKYGFRDDISFLEQKAKEIENKRTAIEVLKVAEKLRNKKREAKFP